MFIATTTVRSFRGSGVDEYDDPTDTSEDDPTNDDKAIPASIIETSRKISDPNSGEARVIRYITGRISPVWDVVTGDRLKDDKTGKFYLVVGTSSPQGPAVTPDTKLDLKQVGG